MREIHWHTNQDEFQYYIKGKARMTVFMPGNFEFPPAKNTPQNTCYFKNFDYKAPKNFSEEDYSV